jgi:hypothetical protein
MSLFMIHHPWPGDTMAREEMLDLVAANYDAGTRNVFFGAPIWARRATARGGA